MEDVFGLTNSSARDEETMVVLYLFFLTRYELGYAGREDLSLHV
jgi:hypothetical protein